MANRNPGFIFKVKNTEPAEYAMMIHSEQHKKFGEKKKCLVWLFKDQEFSQPKYDKPMLKSLDLLEFIGHVD